SHPELVTFTAAGRADVCMRVVSVNSPGRENTFRETVFTGPADVIHDFVTAVFDDCFANASRDGIERFVPSGLFPFPFTAFTGAFERKKNAVGIGYLVQRCRTLRTVAAARTWMFRIAFKLLYFACDLVDVSQQAARGLAIEAGRGND